VAWFVVTAAGATVQEAWDATQTAMIEAWEKWDSLTHPKGYVRTVAYRVFLRQKRKQRFASDEPVPDGVDTALSPDLVVELTESAARVVGLLKHLTATLRVPFALSLEGFSVSEIATITSKTEDTVRRNIHRAKQALASKVTSRGGTR
jgi:RNA polymerase sigma-70 factor (ECF subfamily)